MYVQDIFTNFVASEHLSLDNAKLEQFCYTQKTVDPGRPGDIDAGWRSHDVDLTSPELHELLTIINTRIAHLHERFGFRADRPQKISNVWLNINKYGNSTIPHIHPHCIFSGVYYVKAQPTSGDIVFMNPVQSMEYAIPTNSVHLNNSANSISWSQQPVPGMLLIFPSWIMHYVKQNLDTQDRISITFNSRIPDGLQ